MGENKHIDELDAFAKKYVKEIPAHKPSANFTSSIMDVILTEEKQTIYQNNAKLTNSIWFVLGGFFIALITLLIFGKPSEIKLPKLDFVQIPNWSFYIDFSVSKIIMYVFCCLAILFFIQGYFMKNYFDKRLNQS